MKKFKLLLSLIAILIISFIESGCKNNNIEYTVIFNFNDAYIVVDDIETHDKYETTIKSGENINLLTPYKDGYEFVGWYLEDVKITDLVNVTKDIELFAEWKPLYGVTYSIKYELNGGKFSTTVFESYSSGDEFTLPIPEKEGYVFEGWYLNSDYSGEEKEKILSSDFKDIVLYAKFSIKEDEYKIEYNLNGGYFIDDVLYEYTPGVIYKLPEPEKDEYIFDGWYLNSECTGETITEINTNEQQTISLYAKWEDIYVRRSITFFLEGGKFTSEYPESYPEGKGVNLPTPTRKGYDFAGWKDTSNEKIITEINSKAYGDKVLVAVWEKIYVYSEIEYVLNGGTLESDAPQIYPEGKWITLPTPKKNGYFFRGYYYESDFSGKEITMIDNGKTGKITVYAKWIEANLENAYVSFYGDSITTFNGMIPEGFATYYPLLDVQSVETTWWHQVISKTGSKLLVNNSYGGTAVYGGKNQGMDEERIALLSTKEVSSPDIIIVYLGINDVGNKRSLDVFENGYQSMLNSIKKIYPRAEIFLCTLAYENLTNDSAPGLRDAFSEIITKLANTNNCEIIDFKNAITKDNAGRVLGDRVHPNSLGMNLLADKAIEVLEEFYKNNKKYEIIYELNGGFFPQLSIVNQYKDLKVPLHLPIPEKNGFEFDGWYDNNGNKIDRINIESSGNIKLTAKWNDIVLKEDEVVINFIDYLGNQTVKKIKYGQKVEKVNNSVNGDIEYVWMVGTKLFDFTKPITENITVTETWKSVYEIISKTFSDNVFDDLIINNEYTTSMGKINVTWQSSDKYTVDVTNGRVNPAREDKEVYINAKFTRFNETINYSFKINVLPIEFKSLTGIKPVFAYIYSNTNNMPINDLTINTIDVAHYGFARAISNGTVSVGDLNNMDDVLKLRKQGIRVLLCIGGYGAAGEPFSDVALTKELREKFAASIVETIEKYHFDGVDIDWEYPGYNTGRDTAVDRPNYTLLMEEIKKQVKAKNSDYIVSAALPGGIFGYTRYELNKLDRVLDYVHLMTYDLQSSAKTSHHTSLYNGTHSPFGSVEQTVKTYNDGGISKNKLIVGVAFYGRVFTLSGEVTTILGNTNVLSAGKAITYKNLYEQYLSKIYSSDSSVKRYFDEETCAPYIYDSKNKLFITYDDPESVTAKCKYVNDNDLGGVMFWDYGEDLTFTLLNAIYNEMK